MSIYVNGIVGGTTVSVTGVSVFNKASATLKISGYNNATGMYTGYVSDLRISKGTAVYTGNFTPPTAPLQVTANTAIYPNTANVNTTFAAANTSLLMNFTDAAITDATTLNVVETLGDAKVATANSKFGGSAMFFDGTGDYLKIPSTLAMALGSTFTVECWIYVVSWNTTSPTILDVRDSNIVGVIYLGNDGTARMQTTATGTIASQSGITLNTWTHVAFVSNATSSKVYVNGSNAGATNQGQALFPTTAKAGFIGADFSGGERFNGYIDDLRVTKNIARYTGNFTVSANAAPLR